MFKAFIHKLTLLILLVALVVGLRVAMKAAGLKMEIPVLDTFVDWVTSNIVTLFKKSAEAVFGFGRIR